MTKNNRCSSPHYFPFQEDRASGKKLTYRFTWHDCHLQPTHCPWGTCTHVMIWEDTENPILHAPNRLIQTLTHQNLMFRCSVLTVESTVADDRRLLRSNDGVWKRDWNGDWNGDWNAEWNNGDWNGREIIGINGSFPVLSSASSSWLEVMLITNTPKMR